MRDKTVVVTGGAQGIGEGVARLALERGASRVALLDKNPQALDATVTSLGNQAVGIRADIGKHSGCPVRIETWLPKRSPRYESVSLFTTAAVPR